MSNSIFVTGTFSATGQSDVWGGPGISALSISGFGSATVALERSHDGGSTWQTVEAFTSDTEKNFENPADEMSYRLNCSAYTSGTIKYAMGN